MWQRIQTLYLIIAIILNAVLFLLNLSVIMIDTVEHQLSLSGLRNNAGEQLQSSTLGVLLCGLSILLSLVVIFIYKKRHLQIKMSQLNLVIQLALVVFVFFMADIVDFEVEVSSNILIEYSWGAFISIIPIIFIFLAIKSIKKDEALVRAADRIR